MGTWGPVMSPLCDAFFTPLEAMAKSSHRNCPALSDEHWLRLGVCRVLSDARSGRGFLQQFCTWLASVPSLSLFFESLKSPRRLQHLEELTKALARTLPEHSPALPELEAYELFAGDGHWHAAATHDTPIDERRWAVGHLYALNLRTRALQHLCLCEGKKEHDLGAIKRLGAEHLRLAVPKGRKVLWVWDKAGIDFRLWHDWKMQHGIYFISRAKENMNGEVLGQNPVKPIAQNHGVIADQYVATSQHVMVRRVSYQPPEGEKLEFITSNHELEPGVIAWLYLRRWELEKVYDELKNKLQESKAWASSPVAKQIQAQFICLSHNLLELWQNKLKQEGIVNEAAEKVARQRQEKLRAKGKVSSLLTEVKRPLQTSVKLRRWLRCHWLSPRPLNETLEHLKRLYATP